MIGDPTLAEAVAAALSTMGDFTNLPPAVTDGRLERALREALATHLLRYGKPGSSSEHLGSEPWQLAGTAVRTACAHLATRSVEDAYLALRTASDHLENLRRENLPTPSPGVG